MSRATLSAEAMPLRKRTPKGKRVVAKAVGRDIVYIAGYATSEWDIVESLLRTLFGRDVHGYLLELSDLKKLSEADPACVIISPPLGYEPEFMRMAWRMVRKTFPGVPVTWVSADSNDGLSFLRPDRDVRVVVTEGSVYAIRDFVESVARCIGMKVPVAFASR